MKKIAVILVLLLLPLSAQAVSFDAASAAGALDFPTSRSWAHTLAANATAIFITGGGATMVSSSVNGIPATKIEFGSIAGNKMYAYYLVSPPTGAVTIRVDSSDGDAWVGGAISVIGSATTADVIGAIASTTCSSCTSISKAMTTNRANSIIVSGFQLENNSAGIAETGTNQTNRFVDEPVAGVHGRGTTQPATSTASYTASWSWTNSVGGRVAMIEVREATAPPPAAAPASFYYSIIE